VDTTLSRPPTDPVLGHARVLEILRAAGAVGLDPATDPNLTIDTGAGRAATADPAVTDPAAAAGRGSGSGSDTVYLLVVADDGLAVYAVPADVVADDQWAILRRAHGTCRGRDLARPTGCRPDELAAALLVSAWLGDDRVLSVVGAADPDFVRELTELPDKHELGRQLGIWAGYLAYDSRNRQPARPGSLSGPSVAYVEMRQI
jgi:hypothetical protein